MDKINREQVAKFWRGEWEEERFAGELEGWQHTECGRHSTEKSMWCPKCGKAMTDEAVDLVMQRLEALQDPEPLDKRYKCRYADDNGVCSKLSGNGEIIYCIEGPYDMPEEV